MTKNEIFMKHATKFKGEYIMTEPSAMAAMEEYAQQQVKNLNIPAVIKSVCPRCGSDRWSEDGKMIKQCFDCEYVWRTVL